MLETTSHILSVQVNFDADRKTFSFDGEIDGDWEIRVPPGLQIINFSLHTTPAGSGQAHFAHQPVAAVDTELGIIAEGRVPGHENRYSMVVANSNAGGEPTQFSFVMFVVYDGVAYCSGDPTLINDPPVSGGSGSVTPV